MGWLCHCPSKVRDLSGNVLTCNLSGKIRPQSSQIAESLWTDPGIKSGINVCDLVSTSKKKKKEKMQAGNKWLNSLPTRKRGKSHHQRYTHKVPETNDTKAGAERRLPGLTNMALSISVCTCCKAPMSAQVVVGTVANPSRSAAGCAFFSATC